MLNLFISIICAIAILNFTPIAEGRVLAPIETQISEYITHHEAEQIALLEQLVNINSGTANISGIQQVGEILRIQLNQLGFTTTWVPEPTYMHKAPTLIAKRTGNSGKKILLIGHLDTVFPEHSEFHRFKRYRNSAEGPGIIDDKGGDVIILYALKALAAANALKDTSLTIVFTGDEEESGKPTSISRKPLFDAAKNASVALDFECAITADTATIARRGIANWTIRATGKETHSAEIFKANAGFGAIFELSRILHTIATTLSTEKYLTINPGLILGGTDISYEKISAHGKAFGKENVIAKIAEVHGDLRFLSTEQKLKATKTIIEIVNQHLPGSFSSVKFQEGIPAMAPTANNLRLLKKYSEVSEDLGYGIIKPLDPGLRGAGDISHIADRVPANLAGLGAWGSGAHSPHETLEMASLSIQTKRAALLIYRLTHNNI